VTLTRGTLYMKKSWCAKQIFKPSENKTKIRIQIMDNLSYLLDFAACNSPCFGNWKLLRTTLFWAVRQCVGITTTVCLATKKSAVFIVFATEDWNLTTESLLRPSNKFRAKWRHGKMHLLKIAHIIFYALAPPPLLFVYFPTLSVEKCGDYSTESENCWSVGGGGGESQHQLRFEWVETCALHSCLPDWQFLPKGEKISCLGRATVLRWLAAMYVPRELISFNVHFILCTALSWGTLLVAQLVEALRYKSEGRGFDSR
jgi:hypothetical protein